MANRTWAEIDLTQLRRNLLTIEKAARGRKLALTIKANAYGHGSIEVARTTEDRAQFFLVADLPEAIELQDIGIEKPILVLKPLIDREEVLVAASRGLRILLAHQEELELLMRESKKSGTRLWVHMEIDTGMSRTGFSVQSIEPVLQRLRESPQIRLEGIFTHFATADSDELFVREQLFRFWKALQLIPRDFHPLTVHTANSAALLEYPETLYDMVRPGILLYGLKPREDRTKLDVRPIMEWKTRVVQLRRIKKGQGVSYGHSYVAQRDSTIATLSVGYGDGYPRQLSNKAKVLVRGKRAPLVGTVTMDYVMIDVTDIPEVRLGDTATLLGRDGQEEITAREMANWAQTIHYEIVTRISERVPRIYKDPPSGLSKLA